MRAHACSSRSASAARGRRPASRTRSMATGRRWSRSPTGSPISSTDWHSPLWRHWWQGLARGHRVIRYDERGCGLSDREPERITFELIVADLEAVVDAAGIERFALLGISQGGAAAIAYAARHPERVTRLVLRGAYARGRMRRGPPGAAGRRGRPAAVDRAGWLGPGRPGVPARVHDPLRARAPRPSRCSGSTR